jgi:hypothetical protein
MLTVDGGDAFEIVLVTGGQVVIEGLTLANGLSGRGGCVAVQGFAGGTLVLRDCRVTSCVGFNGGGIASDQTNTRIERCLVDGNSTNGNSGGGLVHDGGLLEIVNSTFSGNATTGDGRPGGGIASFLAESPPAGELVLHNVTLAGNSATAPGGNLYAAAGVPVTLLHTLLADAIAGGNCDALVDSAGHNLSDDATCGLAGSGDLDDTQAELDVLADNGGRTPTHALLAGSAAIDAGTASCPDPSGGLLATDQRGPGFPRPTDGDLDGQVRCDVGAYELAPEPGGGLLAAVGAAALATLARRRPARVPSRACTRRSCSRSGTPSPRSPSTVRSV